MSHVLVWPLVIPFAGAVCCFVLPRRAAEAIGILAAGLTAAAVLPLVATVVEGRVPHIAVGGWRAPLGIELMADGLSALMLLMAAVVGLLVSLYARRYFYEYSRGLKQRARDMFWPIWLMVWASLNALFVSADLFNLYVILELVGLGAVGLVVLTGSREVLGAGLRYLLVAMAGSLCYLMGVALLYGAYGTLDLHAIGLQVKPGALAEGCLVLMTLGLLMKTAIFPLHFWLPPAHSSATAPVSALLSALVVKGSFYILFRLWFEVFPSVATPSFGTILGILGGGAICWGSLQALRAKRLKMLVAHSTVAQLGYLMFVFPVTSATTPSEVNGLSPWVLEACKGTVYHVLAHALAKASLFLVAGNLYLALGNDRLSSLRGLAQQMPFTVFTIALAGVSLMGLPPSGGFVAKWLLLHAVIGVAQWWWAPLIIGGGLLTAGYLFRVLHAALLTEALPGQIQPVPSGLQFLAFCPALLSIVIGLLANDLLYLMPIGTPFSPNLEVSP